MAMLAQHTLVVAVGGVIVRIGPAVQGDTPLPATSFAATYVSFWKNIA